MEIVVYDTLSAMSEILALPSEHRPDALRAMLAPMEGSMPPGDPVAMHRQGGGFRLDTGDADPRYIEALARMSDAGLLGRIEEELGRALDHLRAKVPGIAHPERMRVMFVLGNPDNEHLMETAGGYYGMGSVPGWLYLLAWPSDDVIGRIAHCAVHEFHHNVRYQNVEWNPATVTVGEHVVAEGLAEAFVRELSGPEAMGPWSDMVTGAEFDRAYEKTVADLDREGMGTALAYVLGDPAILRFGGEPAGVPSMSGYAVGLRIVDAHLAASGLTVAESTVLPGRDIVVSAGLRPQGG
ncbi:DUF2268 domain-containing putative Zn-dependent protease [Spongiactinospora sp. TRM90649]|uniref:DUF2268 domain-containing protein n=1 Tax=Spongiactinospora sp. TRM90649 TaxID=3031114 RepID=UPI0023F6C217|nr:DUF2268 domain-containing putative Zn-dependent protease [Spongiactinospora sp. TRM90649]MDF5754480.1 DUF2268 domain-containing putative Zn-dependent protease [Spongiactinospora sp. TRM90649]